MRRFISDLPAGLGAPPSTETLQGTADPNGERSKIAQAPSSQTRTGTRLGVCPTLWPMLQPPQTSRPHLGTRFPAQTIQSHARFPILKKSYAGVPRTSASKSTAPRTHTHTDTHTFHADIVLGLRPNPPPTEIAPMARQLTVNAIE